MHTNSREQKAFLSPYEQQLHRGFAWLRFNSVLEADFRENYHREHLNRLRTHLILGVLLFAGLASVDWYYLSPLAAKWSFIIRLGILPLIAAVTLYSSYRVQRQVAVWLIEICLMAAAIGILVISGIAAGKGASVAISGLTLLCVYAYFMAQLLFFEAVLCGILMFTAFLVMGITLPLPGEVLSYNAIFLACANAFGAVGLYTLEYAQRRDYLQQRLLNDRADRDPLTGLYNRRYLAAHCRDLWRLASAKSDSVAVLMIDIDWFKEYNDAYGHVAGDKALTKVADVLSAQVHRARDVVARFGGEEFTIVWYGVDVDEAQRYVAQLTRAIDALNFSHPTSKYGRLTVSVGVVVDVPGRDEAPEKLISGADDAMYRAKRNGRNCSSLMSSKSSPAMEPGGLNSEAASNMAGFSLEQPVVPPLRDNPAKPDVNNQIAI